jgi:tetratricopeptide (TPR) repeat protein
MAQLLLAEEKVADAEPAAREALEIREKILGPEHPLVADSLALMAGVFSDQDKLEEAEAYGREALSIYEKKDNEITSAATCLKLLVDVLLARHKYGEAEELFQHFPVSTAGGRPTTVGILQARGNLRARLGRWKDAAADFRTAITLEPANHENYYALAPLLLQSADLDGYRSLCGTIRARFGGCTNDPDIAERMAQDCLLLPSPDADLTIEAAWADLAVKLGENEGGSPWCYFCKGLAEYRQRRFGKAVDWIDKSLAREGNRPFRDVQACMVLAMAKYQLNQLYEARAAFARGLQVADHNLAQAERRRAGPSLDRLADRGGAHPRGPGANRG